MSLFPKKWSIPLSDRRYAWDIAEGSDGQTTPTPLPSSHSYPRPFKLHFSKRL